MATRMEECTPGAYEIVLGFLLWVGQDLVSKDNISESLSCLMAPRILVWMPINMDPMLHVNGM